MAAALFAEEARYQWGPFGAILHGPEEIKTRWVEAIDPRDGRVQFGYELLTVEDTMPRVAATFEGRIGSAPM